MSGFNWRDLDQEDFLKWMVVTLLTDHRENSEDKSFEDIRTVTDDFTNVDMKISINGIEVPINRFVDGIKMNMKHYARKTADEVSSNAVSLLEDQITEISNMLAEASDAIRYKVDNFFKE